MKVLQIIFLWLLLTISFATPTQWRSIAPGLQYTIINQAAGYPTGSIHAFRINLKDYQLDLALTHNDQRPLNTVKDVVRKKSAIIGINGGFFSPALTPLGLRIKNGRLLHPLKKTSWWGIFLIQANRAKIIAQKNFRPSPTINFALQSGPRLIVNGRIPSLKPSRLANRSALGITKNGKVIIAITGNLPMTTNV